MNQASTRLVQTPNIAPYHLSLYLVLFRYWNLNKFRNPLSISRIETMYDAKIGSKSTYYKALRELEQMGYLKYHPSKNAAVGSKIYMTIFETSISSQDDHLLVNTGTELNHHENKTSTDSGHQVGTSIKNRNTNKYLNSREINSSPSLDEIKVFFSEYKSDSQTAEKFFNYYEAIDWMIGGKTKITNWKPVAKNWIAREKDYNKKNSTMSHLHVEQNKDYSMPL